MVCDIIIKFSKLSFVAESYFFARTANAHGLCEAGII